MRPPWWGAAFERFAALSSVRIAVVRWEGGDDAIVEWVNPAAAALVGVPAPELIGRPVSEVYPARYVDEIISQFRRAREHGSLSYEVVRELPAGRRTLDAVTVWLGDDLFASYADDVTAEREAQRQLEQLTHLSGIGRYHWNVADGELTWSDEMFELFGHRPGAVDPTPDRYLDHVHPDDRARVEQATTAAHAGVDELSHSRHRIVRRDGEVRTVDVRAQVVTDEDGAVLYVTGVVRDVTDEIELQRHTELVHQAAQQRRTALTVHDQVVQALATVVLALQLDEVDTARTEALAAVTAAQAVVAELLTEVATVEGTIEPGALRLTETDPHG